MVPGGLIEFSKLAEVDLGAYSFAYALCKAIVSATRGEMTRMFEKIYHLCEQWAEKTPAQLRKMKVDLDMEIDSNWSSFKKEKPPNRLMPEFSDNIIP